MNTKNSCFEILGGPNKDSLFDACKYACSGIVPIPIHFTIPIGYTMPKGCPGCAYIPMFIKDIKIMGIEHQGLGSENFKLHGSCSADLYSVSGRANYASYKFDACYNSKNRTGSIVFY